ncbi:hypothetical protein F4802DRAFT_602933 [Xylaria palmicola]|nr:hypothetical protein F4802DRAFT_602933 [Xylaria palmicola]
MASIVFPLTISKGTSAANSLASELRSFNRDGRADTRLGEGLNNHLGALSSCLNVAEDPCCVYAIGCPLTAAAGPAWEAKSGFCSTSGRATVRRA